MRVNSPELPLCDLCQLLLIILGPPRPTLSINLYITGWLDYTVGAFHVSIPVELSLLQDGPGLQCQAEQVVHCIWGWQCLMASHCRSVWSLPCHPPADVGGLALSVAKSHWHGALGSAHKVYTCGLVSQKSRKRELVAAPWTSYRPFFTRVVVESSQPAASESMSL